MTNKPHATGQRATPFQGFEPLTANFVYCPNQFFDVCLPHFSRGTVRLVAYVLRETLAWLDEDGHPIEQNIRMSYSNLISKAGVSRGAIRQAVHEAIAGGFISCTVRGRPDASGQNYQSGHFALRWDTKDEYTIDPKRFRGFFAGEGNRSPIPRQFFTQIVGKETHGVVKVVGTVLRHTAGYQNQFGGRRSTAPLSLSFIQKYANIKSSDTAVKSVDLSLKRGYVRRVEEGRFAPDDAVRKPARYAPNWLSDATIEPTGSKIEAGEDRRFKNRSSSGSRIEAGNRFKNRSSRKKDKKDTSKQQHLVAAKHRKSYELLLTQFDERTAVELAPAASAEEIQQQIDWLPYRNPDKNPQGLLRQAIIGNWSEPPAAEKQKQETAARRCRQRKVAEQANAEADAARRRKNRAKRRETLARLWRALGEADKLNYRQRALDEATGTALKRRLSRCNLDDPPLEVLKLVAADLAIPAGEPL